MIQCNECRQCNHRGKPSVMRESAYCDSHRINNKIIRTGFFKSMKDKIFSLLYDEETNEFKNKGGFRPNRF